MNQARGIYQPLAEKVPLYDLPDEEIDEERSRVPLLIVIALVVLAAFAGVVWLAYNQGVARGRAGTSIVIEAPNGPIRVAPADAGSPTPFTGLKVYSQPVPPDQVAQSSTLAPQVQAPAKTEAPPIRLSPAESPARVASKAPAAPPGPPPALRSEPPAAAPLAPPPLRRHRCPRARLRQPMPRPFREQPCCRSARLIMSKPPPAPGPGSAHAMMRRERSFRTSKRSIWAPRGSGTGCVLARSRIGLPPSRPARN